MLFNQVVDNNRRYIQDLEYQFLHYTQFKYKHLNRIIYRNCRGYHNSDTYNDVIISLDTESSRKQDHVEGQPGECHLCAWTISILAFDHCFVTLYGNKPSECIACINMIRSHLRGDLTYFFVHNLAWDWMFLRKFMFKAWGYPSDQLNTKSHYPISIKFANGLIFRDTLIIAQTNLDHWAKDLGVTLKQKGKWDYDQIRNQDHVFSPDELSYIECDTKALCECVNEYSKSLNKSVYSIPFTATGLVRADVRQIGKENRAKELFKRLVPDYPLYKIMESCFHGGYCHSNRDLIGEVLSGIRGYDFTSSYLFSLLGFKYPMTGYTKIGNMSLKDIIAESDDYSFIFRLVLKNVRLKDPRDPMPFLQFSKCSWRVNAVCDNGRILCADGIEIYINEIDALTIYEQYDYDMEICVDVYEATKGYLPRWFTDYVFELFSRKSLLKAQGIDGIEYVLAKGRANSCFGLCVQKFCQQLIEELYDLNEYQVQEQDEEEVYNKYIKKRGVILPYQWGLHCTTISSRNLFKFAHMAVKVEWVYSDTDSVYATDWDYAKIYEYNDWCKSQLRSNGYDAVRIDDQEFWLGVATSHPKKDAYSEFVTLGAKRYCGRSLKDNKLHITVSGVPKAGAEDLKDDITNFRKGMIFKGTTSGKKLHTYFYVDDIYTDQWGNECGDSIDLNPCDYLLDDIFSINNVLSEEVTINVYNEKEILE